MNWNFGYYVPTEVVFGCGRVAEVGELAKRFGTRALLVTVPEFEAVHGLYEKVKNSLRDAGVEVFHFDGVVPNPTTDVVSAGARHSETGEGAGGHRPRRRFLDGHCQSDRRGGKP